jgi:uncharacterized small protein (DUF1192 family)
MATKKISTQEALKQSILTMDLLTTSLRDRIEKLEKEIESLTAKLQSNE